MDSLTKLKTIYPKTHRLLNNYLNLDFGKTKISCPYWINKIDKNIRGPFGGKGLPGQIVFIAKEYAKKKGINIRNLNQIKLREFLKQNRIGVDCSGLAFNLLNMMDKEKGGNGIADDMFGQKVFRDWNPAWRANADRLTAKNVSHPVNLKDVRIGDTIRADKGKHIMVVVDVKKDSIIYAHSSKLLSKENGVHLSMIKIMDTKKDLSYQVWTEKTQDGKNMKEVYFSVKDGDSIRRFNWW